MKKLFSLVLAVAMVLSMACFASAEENTTLTIVAWDVGTTPYYQAQKEAFEATHPGVTIEYVDVASQDWDTKAGTMLSGGDTSDLFMVKQNINIMNWAQQGFAEPLTDYGPNLCPPANIKRPTPRWTLKWSRSLRPLRRRGRARYDSRI